MPRLARLVIPGYPHHVIQRGNRSQNVFFSEQDKVEYLKLLCHYGKKAGLTFWAYCLMDNHVHFVAVPQERESLAEGFGEVHRRYSRMINFRHNWRGYLWQGRFHSYVLDESYLYAAVRYVERNPVEAGMVSKAEDYRWSSAHAHAKKQADPLCSDFFLLHEIHDWSAYLSSWDGKQSKLIEKHSRSGRPLGHQQFIEKLEKMTGRCLTMKKPGPRSH